MAIKAKLVVVFGATVSGDNIYFPHDQYGTSRYFNIGTHASGTGAALDFQSWAEGWFADLYSITNNGTSVVIEADSNGAQYNFGAVVANTPNGSFVFLQNQSYVPDPPPCDLFVFNVATQNDVNAQGVGQATINAVSSYFKEYSKDNVTWQSSNVLTGYTPGLKTAYVRDSNGCTTTTTFTIQNTGCDLAVTSLITTDETGEDLNDGTVIITASSTQGGVQYSIDDQDNYQSSGSYSGIEPGVHVVYIKDSANCLISQNFTIYAWVPPEEPGVCFNPDIVISGSMPYRFINKYCNPSDETETLFNETSFCNGDGDCYLQKLNCDDVLTLQIYYSDDDFDTTPQLNIFNYDTNVLIETIDFTYLGSGYYKVEKNVNEISNICEKRVYLTIVSYSEYYDTQYFTHAKSEPIFISNKHDCNLLLEYWNNSNYDEVIYQETGYINRMRIEAAIEVDDFPQEVEVYRKSNGVLVPLSNEITEVSILEVNYAPMYVHKKIALALSHDNVKIGNTLYVKEEQYSAAKVERYNLRKGSGKLTTRDYQSKNLIK